MITLQQIALRRAKKVLFENINLTLYEKQKIGLIGDNGCGKSSFFSMLQGELEPSQGNLYLPNIETAHVKQEIPTTSQNALDYVIDGDYRYRKIIATLKQAESTEDARIMAKCHDELANIDGYAIEGKAEKILKGLGFHSKELKNSVKDFSGGWRMRLNLAQALMSRADLMLLDEPTNHLDLDAIIWLEKWLQDYSGTLLVISHDREFLDNIVTHILHFHDRALQLYRGNYSAFENQRAEQLAVQHATYKKQQAQVAHMQSFIDRFRAKASKAKQAQSRMKALEKISLISAVEIRSAFTFSFKTPKACPNPLLRMEDASVGYTQHNPILVDLDLQIVPSERIGLLGVNGAGKSTLIKAIAGKLSPLSGTITLYKGITIGYFAQHQIEHLELELSPLEMVKKLAPSTNEQILRTFLGSFQFTGNMATDKIHYFSGGEKARLALALIVWQAPNLLLLDEPTNHLDMNMREALILALQEYTGALILVSHDRHLIRTTTDELMLVADKKVIRFTGDLDDYKELNLKKDNQPTGKPTKNKYNPGKERRKLETKLHSLEKELVKLQKQKLEVENLLLDQSLYEGKSANTIKQLIEQQTEITNKIKLTEERCLEILEQLN